MSYRLIAVDHPSDDALLDVVFVHGLTGGPFTTWGGTQDESIADPHSPLESGRFYKVALPACMGDDYWPLILHKALLGRFGSRKVNIWALGYPAPVFKREDPYAFKESLGNGVSPCVRELVHGGIGQGASRGVVFMGHSLGGLVVKAILARCEQSNDAGERRLFEATMGVAFLGTPHSGSGLATLAANLPQLLDAAKIAAKSASFLVGNPVIGKVSELIAGFTNWFVEPSNQVEWLEQAGSELRDLAERFRGMAAQRDISTRAYYETQPLKHLAPKNLLWIVDASNADPGVAGCRPIGVPYSDHLEICKPRPDRCLVSDDIQHWIERLVEDRGRGMDVPVLAEEISTICQSIIRKDPDRFKAVLAKIPRRLDEIPAEGQLRTDFSKKFRTEAATLFRQRLSDRLTTAPGLATALEYSDWDLDHLLLYLWCGRKLQDQLHLYLKLLKQQEAGWMEGSVHRPSLIPTFRLVDSLREALVEECLLLQVEFRNTRDWIEGRPDLDGDKRTQCLLKEGENALAAVIQWKKPAKQECQDLQGASRA